MNLLRLVLPGPMRRWLGARHRDWVFQIAIREFRTDPGDAINNRKVISDLIYGWGNESWSALDEFVIASLTLALNCRGPILECGSGLTTVLLGILADRTGNAVWSLEHNAFWADKVRRVLGHYNVNSVHLCAGLLKDYGGYSWYDPPLKMMPKEFALVICDGPPANTNGGRYGLLPVMEGRFSPSCVILLDDAERPHEQEIATRWARELNAECEVLGTKKPFMRISIGKKDD